MSALLSLGDEPRGFVRDEAVMGIGSRAATAYRQAMEQAIEIVAKNVEARRRPYSGRSPAELAALLAAIDPFPDRGVGLDRALAEIGTLSLTQALAVNHPAAMAHLHCPVALPALAAEILLSATNQSLDSWDQSPFATFAEERVIAWAADLCGFGAAGSGCFTSGGSQSNLTGLHLAFEAAGEGARSRGVVFASDEAHFSVQKSAGVLGLSPDAVRKVATDEDGQMSPPALEAAIREAEAAGRKPVAIVATAGTTDLGAIDPLPAIAEIAGRHGVWLHVDAAYGGGLLFCRAAKGRLEGIDRARSIALDFHKMLFQPVSCGVLLVSDAAAFAPLGSKADYLNPDEDVFPGALNLVERSLQTTRRADALKVLLTWRSLGRSGLSSLIEETLANTQAAAAQIEAMPDLTLARRPSLTTVLFRYVSPRGEAASDAVNIETRRRLFEEGRAAIATTRLDGRVHLKLTLLNPSSTPDVVARVLADIRRVANEEEAAHGIA